MYAVFAVAATARASYQLVTKVEEAPVAYVLSAVAAVLYVVATVALAAETRRGHTVATVACSVELAGVLAVGAWSRSDPSRFPDATVWSSFGRGYGFVPLVLPVLGLLWLRRTA